MGLFFISIWHSYLMRPQGGLASKVAHLNLQSSIWMQWVASSQIALNTIKL